MNVRNFRRSLWKTVSTVLGSAFSFLLVIAAPASRADALDQWITRTSPIPVKLFDVTYAAGQFVAVGRETNDFGLPRLLVSSNGSNWVRQISNARDTLRGITHGKGLFVAVGTPDFDGSLPGVVLSTNGVDWSFFTGGMTNGFSAVAFANGLFVAVGRGGKVATSLDGTNWVTRDSARTYDLEGIAYGNGVFVATAPATAPRGGAVQTSPDGTNWFYQPGFVRPGKVIFARRIFVSAASESFGLTVDPIMISPNGTNWVAAQGDTNDFPRGIAYGGVFVAAGTRGLIETSMDGTTWMRRNSSTTAQLYAVAYGNGTFVAVGDVIVQSADVRPHLRFEKCCPQDAAQYHLLLRGLSNVVYQVDQSPNLKDWFPTVINSSDGTESEVFRSGVPGPARFFRARLLGQ